MKKYIKKQNTIIGIFGISISIAILSFSLFSFTSNTLADDFLKQLGISKTDADSKITNSLLFGSLDQYGLRNAKNIATGNRVAVVKDLLSYSKKQVNSSAFIKEYNVLRESKKPEKNSLQSPEELQKQMIQEAKKVVAESETNLKNADANLKKVFEDVLIESKKQLKLAEDPNNKIIMNYRKNYERGAKDSEAGYNRLLTEWEAEYPVNHLQFVKKRLQQFLDETNNIDFSAELITKNGKKYFVNKAYESKGNRWKMAFRAGKEPVEAVRSFMQQWIVEIK
jgi:hypothetical protein